MKATNKLTSLGITLDELYNGKAQIIIHLADKPHQYHVVLVDRSGNPDCKISSWTANYWVRTRMGLAYDKYWERTNKGLAYQKYLSLSTLQSALVRLVADKVETVGDIKFSLSEEVFTM